MRRLRAPRRHTQPLVRPHHWTRQVIEVHKPILKRRRTMEPNDMPVEEAPCPTCAAAATSIPAPYVYALGRIEARFPRLSVEKEFAQVVSRAEPGGKTDKQVFHAVLSKPENRYLARQMCLVFTIQGLDTYILQPRDQAD